MREVPEGPMDPLLATPSTSDSSPQSAPPRLWLKVLPEVAVLCLCVVLWMPTRDFNSSVGGPGPALYPRVLIILLAVAMVVRMLQQLRENRTGAVAPVDSEAPPEEGAEFDESLIDHRRVGVAIAFSILYVLSTLFLGWTIATFVFSIVFLAMAGKRNPVIVLPTALVFSLGFTYVFVKIVYISLPTGSGVFDLITVRLFELMGIY